ncbi:hypothetical protein CPB83DRAFT_811551 [Crepidotus variabilis]|uniref:Uncharacterized protein n=1 Tax=Crepidotus variabilis TaxID=179855 RepID=A0A9P6JRL7_9AGAR|nr:hypothetical protein CPB83DRAFT_811551 [Crepidotus variabilis]
MFPYGVVLWSCLLLNASVSAQTWCGKHYKPELPVTNPGGQFPAPATSKTPLLAFRCVPAIRPYLADDATDASEDVAILIDTPISYSQVANAVPISLPTPGSLAVKVTANGIELASGVVPLNTTKHSVSFSLKKLKTRTEAYNISCTGTFENQEFNASGSLSYLPNPPPGTSVTKMDLRTGGLLARPATGKPGPYAPVFPIGFYTSFGDYLAKDLTIPSELKAQGFNIVHPIPNFDNLTALDLVLDKMQEAGLYLMYDMRWNYMNLTAVTEEVNRIKSRPNLLLWYTADEPDGWDDPLDASQKSAELIQSLDGGDGNGGAGYHPISFVLNCENHYFTEYSTGTDIILQDTYPIDINATFSTVWGTPCTDDYGDCGCDNCKGSFEDISARVDEYRDRLFVNGWERTKAIWSVPQGFGNETYWPRYPTGQEFVVQSILGINHGSLGIVSWDDPTTADIKNAASKLALISPQLAAYVLNPKASHAQVTVNRVDFGSWSLGTTTLVLATNLNYAATSVQFKDVGLSTANRIEQILDTGAKTDEIAGILSFESIGSGGFIIHLA